MIQDIFIRKFKQALQHKKLKISVVGLGYVGLPLAVEFAKKGFAVLGIDLDKDRLSRIKRKVSYITDVATADLRKLIANGKFKASCDFSLLKDSDVIIICVPTPLKRKYSPDISFIIAAVRQIKKNLRAGQLVILESTTYPGTTEEVILPLLESGGLKCGEDFYLAFSPERIDPGNKHYPVHKIPKVVGGIGKEAGDLAACLYQKIVSYVVPVSSARVAETVKLLENTFRIVNIGLIDEMAMMAHKMNIDIWEVISAASTKPFGFMPFYPGPGVGGHCIPKDPLYLYWKARKFGFNSRFIKLASEIIAYMPEYVVSRLTDILNKNKIRLRKWSPPGLKPGVPKGGILKPPLSPPLRAGFASGVVSRILVIGVAYKKDVKDLRKSPALDIIEILQKKKIAVSYYDPLIPYLKLNHINLQSINLTAQGLSRFDCVVIATDHTCVDYGFILKNAKFIFDLRNVYGKVKNKKIFRL